MSAAEDALAFALRANGIDGWEREHQFDRSVLPCECESDRTEHRALKEYGGGALGPVPPRGHVPGKRKPWVKCKACNGRGFVTTGRKWALDFAFAPEKVGVEVNGGGWTRGRHHRPEGHAKDCEKLTAAQVQGWLVVLCTPEQVRSGEAVEWIEQALRQRRGETQ